MELFRHLPQRLNKIDIRRQVAVPARHPVSPIRQGAQPDGVLLHNEDKRIIVLEFKRTSDFWPDSFTKGYLRKWVKYAPLVASLREANPGWTVDLAIFVL